jgi:hypothetical protein
MNDSAGTTTENGGNFDPQLAAALLEQTTRRARRKFQPSPPWLMAIRAVLALAAFGTVWLSVRGQNPYTGPTAPDILVVPAFAVFNFGATVAARKRAFAGVSGRSRLSRTEIAVLAVAWAAVFAVMAALASAGVSDATVYGRYPATAPLIAAGLVGAGMMAVRADWRACATALAVAVTGVAGTFAGPAGAWAVDGVGLCVTLLGSAAAVAWQLDRW